jgi:hypothetical protein
LVSVPSLANLSTSTSARQPFRSASTELDRAENLVTRPSCQRTEKNARAATRQSAATQSLDPRTVLVSGS